MSCLVNITRRQERSSAQICEVAYMHAKNMMRVVVASLGALLCCLRMSCRRQRASKVPSLVALHVHICAE
jgi:hypothetical protein